MTTKNKIIAIALSFAAMSSVVSPVFAQGSTTSSARANAAANRTTTAAANIQKRIANWQARGAKEIDARIASMNDLLTRVQAMKNVSDADKATLNTEIQSLESSLTNLKTSISSDTSSTTLATDVKSITQSYRVYMLVEPQVRIIAAADRIKTIVDQLTVIDGKIQSRLATDPTASANAAVQSALTDITAKLNDASSQAQAAVTEVTSLKPDQGDQTVMQANTSSLKDARSKIATAQKDLVSARKDVQSIIKALGQSKFTTQTGGTMNATSTQ